MKARQVESSSEGAPIPFSFQSLVLTNPRSLTTRRRAPWGVSLVVHTVLIAAAVIVPLFFHDVLPAPDEAVCAFIVTPALAAPPPPPPPLPAPGPRATARTPVAPRLTEPAKFVAPIETPKALKPQEGISLGVGEEPEAGASPGVEGGAPGGGEGGG